MYKHINVETKMEIQSLKQYRKAQQKQARIDLLVNSLFLCEADEVFQALQQIPPKNLGHLHDMIASLLEDTHS